MHPTTTHHTHPSTVSSEPAVHTRQEPSEPRVSLLLGLLRQFTISSLDIVFLQGSGSRNLNTKSINLSQQWLAWFNLHCAVYDRDHRHCRLAHHWCFSSTMWWCWCHNWSNSCPHVWLRTEMKLGSLKHFNNPWYLLTSLLLGLTRGRLVPFIL